MIFAAGELLPQEELPALLDTLEERLNETRSGPPLDVDVVLDAVDRLGRALDSGELAPLLAQYAPPSALEELREVRGMLCREVLEERLQLELGDLRPGSQVERPFGRTLVQPLGVLLHVTPGNQVGIPLFSALEGLLTGNLNLIKLPHGDRGLTLAALKLLTQREPRLAPWLYAFEVSSKDTGTLERLAAVLTAKSQEYGHPIYLISDEPYREIVFQGFEVPWVPHIYRDTIVCYSFSKSLSLPGERIGYICVPDGAADSGELYAAVAGAARAGGHVCAPSLWQKVIARCAGLRPDLAAYEKNRRALQESLTAMGYRMASPDGAFYLFIQAPNGDDLAFSEMAKEKNLLLVPGTGFGCPGWFRICYCVSYDMIQRSLPVFQALMEACRS